MIVAGQPRGRHVQIRDGVIHVERVGTAIIKAGNLERLGAVFRIRPRVVSDKACLWVEWASTGPHLIRGPTTSTATQLPCRSTAHINAFRLLQFPQHLLDTLLQNGQHGIYVPLRHDQRRAEGDPVGVEAAEQAVG